MNYQWIKALFVPLLAAALVSCPTDTPPAETLYTKSKNGLARFAGWCCVVLTGSQHWECHQKGATPEAMPASVIVGG